MKKFLTQPQKWLVMQKNIAKAMRVKLPNECLTDFNKYSNWITKNKDNMQKIRPTQKQITFARSLAKRKRRTINDATLSSKLMLSEWISQHRYG